jgi:hypothetical protein
MRRLHRQVEAHMSDEHLLAAFVALLGTASTKYAIIFDNDV